MATRVASVGKEEIDFDKFRGMEDTRIECLPELKKRLEDVYIGIVDADGIESFMRVLPKTLKELAHDIFCLQIRAQANPQRNAVFYSIKLHKETVIQITDLIAGQDFRGAGDILTLILDCRDKSRLTDINKKLRDIQKIRGYF